MFSIKSLSLLAVAATSFLSRYKNKKYAALMERVPVKSIKRRKNPQQQMIPVLPLLGVLTKRGRNLNAQRHKVETSTASRFAEGNYEAFH